MTTPATPAADAVSQLTGKLKMLKSSAFAHLDRSRFPHMQIKANTVADLCDEVTAVIATATARESALVAERDALRAAIEALKPIGALIRTQDNRITDQPMFIVQERRIICGIDLDYTDNVAWSDADSILTDGPEFDAFEAAYDADETIPEGWTRTGYQESWDYVTACFTEQGCKDFIAINGHNLKEPRIYADGSYRNNEFRAIRNTLAALAAPAVEG